MAHSRSKAWTRSNLKHGVHPGGRGKGGLSRESSPSMPPLPPLPGCLLRRSESTCRRLRPGRLRRSTLPARGVPTEGRACSAASVRSSADVAAVLAWSTPPFLAPPPPPPCGRADSARGGSCAVVVRCAGVAAVLNVTAVLVWSPPPPPLPSLPATIFPLLGRPGSGRVAALRSQDRSSSVPPQISR